MAPRTPPPSPAAQVSVIVIGYNDAAHLAGAVHSALRQGTAVAEVIAVDDASTDATPEVLRGLAARYARLRVVRRETNSGGCGTPRNDGLRLATAPYVMFLDSDDVLEAGAVEALYRAAVRHDAQVVAGRCVRRELPGGRDVPWQRALFTVEAAHGSPAELPRLVHDTVCVNKLYSRTFLEEHGIAFPDGAFRYEDFVFTARVLAASPRIAVVPDTVYIWHVRRSDRPSISLARGDIGNWRSRLEAQRRTVEIFEEAGQKELTHAAQVKFLDDDLRIYARELATRDPDYRAAWWRLTREHLADADEAVLRAARAPARWIARVVAAADGPRDLERIAGLANRPARLLPPYVRAGGRPVWDAGLPGVVLDGLDTKPMHRLPVTVDAEPRLERDPRPGRPARLRLTVRVHELYGRLAAAGPSAVDVELRHRDDGRLGVARDAALNAEDGVWTADILLDPGAVAASGRRREGRPEPDVWDVRVRLRCADGSSLYTAARATGPGLRRAAVPSGRRGLVLVQPYATSGGSLAVRIAAGPGAATALVRRRLRRLAVRGRRRLGVRRAHGGR
ncbi:glycosyltransferase family 2 protein [Streptomyces sp. NPDC048639]|uniref:glycosyltransferase family 2 protein n=1 Tax=Streptomyces sp. NPDC048639 TaxID=3365581 RepID=UPI003719073A